MTANMQDTTGTHPLAGLHKSAALPQSADRVPGGENGEAFGEVLDALGAKVPVVEAKVDQEDDTLLPSEPAEDAEGDELVVVPPDEWSNAIEDADETLETTAAGAGIFPLDVQRDLSKWSDSRDFGVSLTARSDRESVAPPNSPPNMNMIADPKESLADRPEVQNFEGRDEPTERISIADLVRNNNRAFPTGDDPNATLSRVTVERGVDVDLHDAVGEGDPMTAEKPNPERSAPLAGAFGLTTHEFNPSAVEMVEGTEVRSSMVSQPQAQSTAEMRLLGSKDTATRDNFVAQQASRDVGTSIPIEETVETDSPSSPEVEFDFANGKTPTNTPSSQFNSMPWQNTSVSLDGGQSVAPFDLGGTTMGNLERGYGEISKLDVAPTNGGTSALGSASTALHASQQIARVAQSQPGGPVELALNPEELGRVKLTFTSHENTLVVTIVGERSDTIDLMRRHIDSLSQEFKNIGYSNVSFSFSQSESGGSSGQGGSHGDLGSDSEDASAEAGELDLSTDANVQVVLGRAGLDIRI